MDNNRIQAIIFDLGNVLIDFDHTIAANRISHFCDKSPDQIYSLFFDSDLTCLFEEGKIKPHDFFLKVKEMLNLRLDYDSFVPIWNEIFFLSAKNRDVYSLANALKNHYRIALISNINILHFEYLKKNFPIFDVFHNVSTSFELGLTKPGHSIYKKILEILKVSAPEAFYTDDREELVKSARELGINGFVFKGIEQLKNNLLDLGVKIN